jgi:hypothetical protein
MTQENSNLNKLNKKTALTVNVLLGTGNSLERLDCSLHSSLAGLVKNTQTLQANGKR